MSGVHGWCAGLPSAYFCVQGCIVRMCWVQGCQVRLCGVQGTPVTRNVKVFAISHFITINIFFSNLCSLIPYKIQKFH